MNTTEIEMNCSFGDEFEIITYASGVKTIRSINHGETFHPKTGPLAEANLLYVEQQKLVERCSYYSKNPHELKSKSFTIWDVGLGAAANAIAAIEALGNCTIPIEIHSFDKTTAPIEFALKNSKELGYLVKYEDQIRRLIKQGQVHLTPHLLWQFHPGEFQNLIQNQQFPSPHAIFYDPYSPKKCPELWNLEHFTAMYDHLDSEVPCVLTNYTRSTAVRVSLLLAGFHVGQGCAVGEKAESTIASNHIGLIENPLNQHWLERVKRSTHSAPLRLDTHTSQEINETDLRLLYECSQFVNEKK